MNKLIVCCILTLASASVWANGAPRKAVAHQAATQKTIKKTSETGQTAHANEHHVAKVQFIKKLYREAKKPNGLNNLVLEKYASPSLKRAIQSEEEPRCLTYDIVWRTPDPNVNAPVTINAEKDGKIKASFVQDGKRLNVLYTLYCKDNQCKIADVDNLKKCLTK